VHVVVLMSTLLLLLGFSSTLASGFEWVGIDRPPGTIITALRSGEAHLFAGTNDGLYRAPLSSPEEWEAIGFQTRTVVDVVAGGPDDTYILVALEGGDFLYRSWDGGETWINVPTGSYMSAGQLSWNGLVPGRIWAVFAQEIEGYWHRTVCHTADLGASWICPWTCDFDCTVLYLGAPYLEPDKIYVIEGANPLLPFYIVIPRKSRNAGQTWEELPIDDDLVVAFTFDGAVNPADTEQLFMSAYRLHRWDGGTYAGMWDPGIRALSILTPPWGEGGVYLFGVDWDTGYPKVQLSFDAGETWAPLSDGLPEVEYSVWNDFVFAASSIEPTLFLFHPVMGFWMLEFNPSSAGDDVVLVNQGLQLLPGKPNPFSSRVNLAFQGTLEPGGRAEVLDLSGRRIRTLALQLDEASRIISWDGRLENGKQAGSGVYLIRVANGDRILTRRVTLLR
jgi:hypothetical protein